MKPGRLKSFSATMVLLSLSCTLSGPIMNLRWDLQAKVSQNGLYVAKWNKRSITLFPFAPDPRRIIELPENDYFTGWFTPDGRNTIVLEAPRLLLLTLKGEVVVEHKALYSVMFAAVSQDRRRIGFTTLKILSLEGNPHPQRLSYYYGDLGSDENRLLTESEDLRSSETIAWSPDGRRMLVGIGEDIRAYDVEDGSYSTIAKGRDPTWSPDGRYVALRNVGRGAAVVELANGRIHPHLSGRDILDRLDWSPDSEYLLFSEKRGERNRMLAVVRLRDDITTDIFPLYFEASNWPFGWALWGKDKQLGRD